MVLPVWHAIRPIAVTSPARHRLLPEVPTMQEAGLQGFAATSWQGLFAPAGTPRPVLDRLGGALQKTLAQRQTRLDDQFNAAYERYLAQFSRLQSLTSQMEETSGLFGQLSR